MRFGIPYKVVGGTRFYDRREIKDAMAYLRAVVNPADEVSVKRVLDVPKRGVGDASVAKLDALAASTGIALRRGHAPRRTTPASPAPAARGVESFVAPARRSRRLRLDDGARRPAAGGARPTAGYLAELEAEGSVESAGRIENLGELVGSAREFTRLDEFLEQVALVADTDDLDDDDQVVLMTLHSAKGLEFPAVFLVGMEEGVFPHSRALTEPTSWRRSAGSPTSASPAPSSGCSWPTPGAGSCSAAPTTTRRRGSSTRSPPSSSSRSGTSAAAARTVARAIAPATSGPSPPPYRRARSLRRQRRRRAPPRTCRRGCAGCRPAPVSDRRRRMPVDRVARSATTSSTPPSARASSSTSAVRTTRPKPRSASAMPVRSTCRWPGRR